MNGMVQSLPHYLQQGLLLQIMLSEAVKTSEIKGEYLSREDVLSSIRNNLGLNDDLFFQQIANTAFFARIPDPEKTSDVLFISPVLLCCETTWPKQIRLHSESG